MRGFTIIELLIVVMIMGLLLGIATLNFVHAQKLGRDSKRFADMQILKQALEQYYNAYGYYPGSTTAPTASFIRKSVAVEQDWIGKASSEQEPLTPRFAKVLPRDPLNQAEFPYVYVTHSSDKTQYYLATKLEARTDESARDGGFCTTWYEVFTPKAANYGRNYADLPGC